MSIDHLDALRAQIDRLQAEWAESAKAYLVSNKWKPGGSGDCGRWAHPVHTSGRHVFTLEGALGRQRTIDGDGR